MSSGRLWMVLVLSLSLIAPALADDSARARFQVLIGAAAQGSLDQIQTDVQPPESFDELPLATRLMLYEATDSLRALVATGPQGHLGRVVDAATWQGLSSGKEMLDRVAAAMADRLHGSTKAAMDAYDLMPLRVLVGTSNWYLREMADAETQLDGAFCVHVARSTIEIASRPDVLGRLHRLIGDTQAPAEIREKARHLLPLIHETRARVEVALIDLEGSGAR